MHRQSLNVVNAPLICYTNIHKNLNNQFLAASAAALPLLTRTKKVQKRSDAFAKNRLLK